MKFDNSAFRANLRYLIGSHGYTNLDVAKQTGIGIASISRYLCSEDRTPRLEQVILFAEFFNVSVDWLLGLDKTVSANSVSDLYNIASPDDRAAVDSILRKYRRSES